MLRCCHLDGLNQTDQHKVDASLIYADWHRPASTGINRHQPASTGINRHQPASTGIDRHQPALTSIYKTCTYFILVSLIQTTNMTTSQGPWALGQGIVQGKFQGNNIYKFLGTFLGKL